MRLFRLTRFSALSPKPRLLLKHIPKELSIVVWKYETTDSSRIMTKAKEYNMKPFWKLKADIQNVEEISIDTNHSEKLMVSPTSIADFKITRDDATKTVTLDFATAKRVEMLYISLPLQSDLNFSARKCGTARINNIENNTVKVETDSCDIELGSIKSNIIQVETVEGNIFCKSTRGNVKLNTIDGNIATGKIQGNTLELETVNGSIATGDIYSQDLSVITSEGSIRLKSVHGDCEIQAKKSINIGTAEGRLNATSAENNIQVHLTDKIEYTDIVTNYGDVDLSFSPELGGQLDIEAQQIDDTDATSIHDQHQRQQGPCLRYRAELNNGGPRIIVKALSGTVKLKTTPWVDAVSQFNKTKV